MPALRVYNLPALWSWLDGRQVTARDIAEHLGCSCKYVGKRILPALDAHGYYLVQLDERRKTRGRWAVLYEIMRPDENDREK